GRAGARAELDALQGFLRSDGSRLIVDRAFAVVVGEATREPDPDWCEAVADEMVAAGDLTGALDLDLGLGAVERAAGRLAEHEVALAAVATPADVQRWLTALGDREPALADRLQALRRRLESAPSIPPPGSRAPVWSWRGAPGARAIGSVTALAVFALGWLLPAPEGLERAGFAALAAIL